MRLKTFTADSMAAAMKLVRAELGADAIIVSSQELDRGAVEVVAAVEPYEDGRDAFEIAPLSDAPDDAIDALQDILDYHRVPAALAGHIADAASGLDTQDSILALAGALDAQFSFAPLGNGPAARPLFLIGPPGAGKTVTLAKLAARARLAKRSVALVTTDTLRTGAPEQFASYADLLGIDPQIAGDAATLRDALAACGGAAMKIIDSAGANPFDAEDMARLDALIAAANAEPLLVLPAGMDADEAADAARAFAQLGAVRLIATRLDTARRLGGILAAAGAARLRLSDVGTGPHLADGLAPLNPLAFARLLASAPADRVATLAADEPPYAESLP